ncbi:hypothetical protein L2E82_49178 [Cichorium intybus]|uniref:Uncharacterized protein n=1 Tax=Cichorium intybus TaxID=13427 RepID=A0ACB8YZR8_CICIN|nr:hypothetical protein L2E82_49178 [Cichorium intybus]
MGAGLHHTGMKLRQKRKVSYEVWDFAGAIAEKRLKMGSKSATCRERSWLKLATESEVGASCEGDGWWWPAVVATEKRRGDKREKREKSCGWGGWETQLN